MYYWTRIIKANLSSSSLTLSAKNKDKHTHEYLTATPKVRLFPSSAQVCFYNTGLGLLRYNKKVVTFVSYSGTKLSGLNRKQKVDWSDRRLLMKQKRNVRDAICSNYNHRAPRSKAPVKRKLRHNRARKQPESRVKRQWNKLASKLKLLK